MDREAWWMSRPCLSARVCSALEALLPVPEGVTGPCYWMVFAWDGRRGLCVERSYGGVHYPARREGEDIGEHVELPFDPVALDPADFFPDAFAREGGLGPGSAYDGESGQLAASPVLLHPDEAAPILDRMEAAIRRARGVGGWREEREEP